MKPDDFEQRLRCQPRRQIPTEWRGQILAAADVRRRVEPALESTFAAMLKLRLRELLWPCPQAWAGLATIWLVILAVNLAMRDESPRVAKRVPPPSPEMILALREQKQLLAELTGTREIMTAERPKSLLPRPRSERPKENADGVA